MKKAWVILAGDKKEQASEELASVVHTLSMRVKKLARREELEDAALVATEEGLRCEALLEKLPMLVKEALEVLENPPLSWTSHHCDAHAIYKMEAEELERAISEAKGEKAVDKEACHLLAAAIALAVLEEGKE